MYQLERSTKFKKDIRLAIKRGLDLQNLEDVVTLLVTKGSLPPIYKPHKLKGNYAGLWECHIQPDWLLIWEQDDEIRLISLIRMGTHSDLF